MNAKEGLLWLSGNIAGMGLAMFVMIVLDSEANRWACLGLLVCVFSVGVLVLIDADKKAKPKRDMVSIPKQSEIGPPFWVSIKNGTVKCHVNKDSNSE